ncbi:MAG: hypothetical protein JO100_11205 [Pseudonocardia sp.]|nr:hypothetical protein [Pseudonocardia sp.]
MSARLGWRVAVPTAATAVVGSGVAVVINLATEWKTNPWAWIVVGVLTLLAMVLALWLASGPDQGEGVGAEASSVSMSGTVRRDNIQFGQVGGNATIHRDR